MNTALESLSNDVSMLANPITNNQSGEEGLQWFDKVCEPLNQLLKDNEYLVENRFSAAGVVTGGV